MGLDMYFKANRYFWFMNDDDVKAATQISEIFPETEGLRITNATVMVKQWRKANAIHKWFVENVQAGEDDCGEYGVCHADIAKLLEVCNAVLADTSKAPELLPTTNGFFFGSVEYDEWYWRDIEDTKAICERVLNNWNQWAEWSFTYQASW